MMQKVWDILTSPSEDKKVRWFAKSDRGNLGGIVLSPDELENVARLSHQGYNVYVTLNPTNRRICKRINHLDVDRWAFILIDMDPVEGEKDAFDSPIKASAWMIEKLRAIHPELGRPAVVRTGRGVQLWLRLLPQDCRNLRNYFTDVNRGFLIKIRENPPPGWRIDMCSDLARVARLPHSINQKTRETAWLIDSGEMLEDSTTLWVATEFYKPSAYEPGKRGELDKFDRTWDVVMDELTLRAKNYLTLGAAEGNRHASCHHLCRTLWELGVTRDSAYDAMEHANQANEPSLTTRDHRDILEQVYRNF